MTGHSCGERSIARLGRGMEGIAVERQILWLWDVLLVYLARLTEYREEIIVCCSPPSANI